MRAFITGNIFGAGNIGDDAVLQGLLSLLDAVVFDNVYVTCGSHCPAFLPPNAECVKYNDEAGIKRCIQKTDIIIIAGGTMIGDELSLRYPLAYNSKILALSKYYSKKTCMLYIGANRLITCWGRFYAKGILNLSDFVVTRDQKSLEVCNSLGIENIYKGADPAFVLNPVATAKSEKLKQITRRHQKTIGINVVNESWASEQEYKKVIARSCSYLHDRHGYVPIFFCTEVREGDFYDYSANSAVIKLLDCPYEVMDALYLSPEEMIDVISAFDIVFAMRMHALIFAALANVPFLALSRIDKVDNFMELFKTQPCGTISACNADSIVQAFENLCKDRENRLTANREIILDLQKRLFDSRTYLQEILNAPCRFKINLFSIFILFRQNISFYIRSALNLVRRLFKHES
jgi:polysaccharide pyruvyl transferase WcaK-like protein